MRSIKVIICGKGGLKIELKNEKSVKGENNCGIEILQNEVYFER
jgi:hypothetical protein